MSWPSRCSGSVRQRIGRNLGRRLNLCPFASIERDIQRILFNRQGFCHQVAQRVAKSPDEDLARFGRQPGSSHHDVAEFGVVAEALGNALVVDIGDRRCSVEQEFQTGIAITNFCQYFGDRLRDWGARRDCRLEER